MPNNKVIKFNIPLWPNRYIYFCTDSNTLEARIKKDTGEIIEIDNGFYGQTWSILDKDIAIYVNTKMHKTKKDFIITAAHEAHHAAYAILNNIGESNQAEEIAARYQDYILENIL